MVDGSELEDEIARLRDLDLPTLRARWRTVFRRKAPEPLPRHLLFRILAYRFQAERLGDLDQGTVRLLDRIASGSGGNALSFVLGNRSRFGRLQPGSMLVREWDGARQRVVVLDKGFAWNGQPTGASPQSLSPSPEPGGRGHAFSACVVGRRGNHEPSTRQAGSLRHLCPGLHRP